MEASIEKTSESVAKAIANRNNLQKKLETAKENYKTWTERAERAAEKDQDDLAKKALAKRKIEKANIDTLEPMIESSSEICENLKEKLTQFKLKLDNARNRESILIARANQAKTQKEFNKILSEISSDNGFSKFDKYEKKIQGMESEAEAYEELAGDEKNLEERFNDLDDVDLDTELAEMKESLKQSTDKK